MNSLKTIFRSACIAVMSGMLGNAAQAQEVTAASLKGMSESSAVRMGCGAAFIGDMNGDASVVTGVNAAGIVRGTADFDTMLATRTIGSLALLAIIFVALRLIPKEKKEVLWKLIKVGAVATFLGGVLFVLQNPWAPIDDFTGASLWASTLIAVPVIISTIVRIIWASAKFLIRESAYAAKKVEEERTGARKMRALPEEMTVSVRGCEVTLRNGDTQVTRVVEMGEATCATK